MDITAPPPSADPEDVEHNRQIRERLAASMRASVQAAAPSSGGRGRGRGRG